MQAEFVRLLGMSTWQHYPPDVPLKVQDQRSSTLYLIVSGLASVDRNGSRIAYVGKGSFVGEMGKCGSGNLSRLVRLFPCCSFDPHSPCTMPSLVQCDSDMAELRFRAARFSIGRWTSPGFLFSTPLFSHCLQLIGSHDTFAGYCILVHRCCRLLIS